MPEDLFTGKNINASAEGLGRDCIILAFSLLKKEFVSSTSSEQENSLIWNTDKKRLLLHLSCAVGFISHKSALWGEARQRRYRKPSSAKRQGVEALQLQGPNPPDNGESEHSSEERAMTLVAEDVLAQQESGTSQTVWKTYLRQRQEKVWILSAKAASAFSEETTSAMGESDCSLEHGTITHQCQGSVTRLIVPSFVTVIAGHWDHIRD